MSTNVAAQSANPNLDKTVQTVMEGLGLLYKECHSADPSGQACQAVQQIMQAVSEVANSIGQNPAATDPFQQASQNVNQQMMSQAQQPQGMPSPEGY